MRALLLALAVVFAACPAPPGSTACTKHDDCKGLKNGYCARAQICTHECSSAADCETGSDCFDAGARQVCLPTCTDDAGCPTRFGCRPGGSASVCQLDAPFDPPK